MAGFGSISLAQTVVGTLLDQRAIVLYAQPEVTAGALAYNRTLLDIGGLGVQGYQELFSGLLGEAGIVGTTANQLGVNPYGITYIDAKVNLESDLMEHPTEIGVDMTDTAIRKPTTAEVTVAMPTHFANEIYESMQRYFGNGSKQIILQTKYGVYTNMVLKDISYELVRDKIDRTVFTLSLREIQLAYEWFADEFNSTDVVNGSDASTVSGGSQMAIEG